METDKIEEIIKEIALKHGIAVGRDDPILVLQTINARLMADTAAAQQEALNAFKEEIEAVSFRWGEDARIKAERSLNAALTANREAMARAAQEGAQLVRDTINQEIRPMIGALEKCTRDGNRIAIINMIASALSVFAAGLVAWKILG